MGSQVMYDKASTVMAHESLLWAFNVLKTDEAGVKITVCHETNKSEQKH